MDLNHSCCTNQQERAEQELRSLAYAVAHDLRSPLQGIDLMSHLLECEHGKELSNDATKLVSRIREQVTSAGRMLDGLTEYSRVVARSLSPEPVDLNRIAQGVISGLVCETENRSIHFDVADLPTVQGDYILLVRLFFELLTNGVKSSAKSQEAALKIWSENADGMAVVRVGDNGIGFEMKRAENLFVIFGRLHSRDEFDGRGVGLAIARHIVERHGGRIWAESERNQGATFSFALPN